MRVIVPVELTSANLIHHTVAEPDLGGAWLPYSVGAVYSEGQRVTSAGRLFQSRRQLNMGNPLPTFPEMLTMWWDTVTEATYSSTVAYALGDQVVDTASHRRYESVQAGNTGKPLPVFPETSTSWWLDIGVTNRWACLDVARNTQTIAASPLVIVFTPTVRVNSIAIMGVDCDTATVTTSTGYSYTQNMMSKPALDWCQYFFDPFAYERSLVLFDLPPDSGMTITVILTKAQNPVRLGSVVVGNYSYLGQVQYNAVSDALNFSGVERDLYGTAALIPRRSVPKTNQTLMVDKKYVNQVRAARAALNAVPAVWCGLDDANDGYYESVQIVGIYKAFSIDLAYPDQAKINLELEEI